MTCEVIQTECLGVGDRVPITLDFSQVATRHWRAASMFALNDLVRGKKSGYEFEATTAGQTGNREPSWPRTPGATVEDGSVVWTVRAITTDSLLKILSTVAWTAPTGITVSGESIDTTTQTASAYLEATATGTYEVLVRPTFNDTPAHTEGYILAIEVE